MRVRLTLAEGHITDYELVLLNLLKGEQKVSRGFFVHTMQIPSLKKVTEFGATKIPAESSSLRLFDLHSSTDAAIFSPKSIRSATP